MSDITISQQQIERLLNSIYWALSPYMDDNSIAEHPWLVELADCYNELYSQLPSNDCNYEIIYY